MLSIVIYDLPHDLVRQSLLRAARDGI
jgi:hypothetical protein